ncbi:ABC transporter permease [Humisphaera borealis]|uniref:ABC transporter permease n=1 Tax=Humisphaera borealis TaxID=2807512 RepID=A0A7M2WUX9_9BACT|nr:ABC transporter permease [Humisphaera borealis]QOV89256.1 ABC transporter permease [Humisphaera borealis]
MSTISSPISAEPLASNTSRVAPDTIRGRMLRSGRILIGGGVLLVVVATCLLTLPMTLGSQSTFYYDGQNPALSRAAPAGSVNLWFGTDMLGRSLLGRCLLGGAISLLVGIVAATISVVLGVSVGLISGYRGGWIDSVLMRFVDIMYGLPYILLIILFKLALEPFLATKLGFSIQAANLCVLFLAIGLVSWLTMARVVRGQVLSLRAQPFIEACRASGLPEWRIFTRHLLPNLIGPITVYATLTVPQAILQESFLSFLGIGIQQPMPTWGALASEGLLPSLNTVEPRWWLLTFPCVLLAITLLSLNFLGDGLRDVFDPKREAAKI